MNFLSKKNLIFWWPIAGYLVSLGLVEVGEIFDIEIHGLIFVNLILLLLTGGGLLGVIISPLMALPCLIIQGVILSLIFRTAKNSMVFIGRVAIFLLFFYFAVVMAFEYLNRNWPGS